MRNMLPYLNILKDFATHFRIPKHLVILEIGVARGNSTSAFLGGLGDRHKRRHGGTGELYSIDINDCYERVATNTQFLKHWHFIQGDSKEIKWDKEIDIFFIDGNHGYNGVKMDFEKYEPFVRQGGIILMHDVIYPKFGIKKYWEEITLPKVILPLNRCGLGIVSKYKDINWLVKEFGEKQYLTRD